MPYLNILLHPGSFIIYDAFYGLKDNYLLFKTEINTTLFTINGGRQKR